MILRRIAEHVKAQNWVAVAIDFAIVVIGVYLGVQVSNWNEARKTKIEQSALLERLADELRTVEPVLAQWLEQMEATTTSTGAIVEALRAEAPPADLAAFRRNLAQANFMRTMPALSTNYTALLSSGAIASIEDDALRAALIRYGDAHAQAERFYPGALAVIFKPDANYFEAVEWAMDPAVWENDPILRYDWEKLRASRAEMQAWITFQNELVELSRKQLREVRTILEIVGKTP